MADNKPVLESVIFRFTQDENCCSATDEGIEELIVKCESSLGIGRDNDYFMTLTTKQWSIDRPAELAELLGQIVEMMKPAIKEKINTNEKDN